MSETVPREGLFFCLNLISKACNFVLILYIQVMKTEFSSHLKSILWEYDIDALDFHDNIVIERILKF
jgi:hypothetical protein